MAYQLKNRLHSFARWPADPKARYDLAVADLDFVVAMHRCGFSRFDCPKLNEIALIAHVRRLSAMNELEMPN
jgi:hypothetical protein